MVQNFMLLVVGLMAGMLAVTLWRSWQARQQAARSAPVDAALSWPLLARLHPNDALIAVNKDGSMVNFNAKASLWLGMDAAPGQSLWQFFDSGAESRLQHAWQKASRNEDQDLGTLQLQGAGFTTISVDVQVVALHDSFADYLVKLSQYSAGQSADIRDNVLDSIKENLLNSNISAIVAVDESDRIIEFNPCAERLFGYQRQQVLGNTMADLLIPAEFRAMHYAGMRRFISQGSTSIMNKRVEVSAINAQGQAFPIEIEVSPCRQEGGWIFIAVIQDISARKLSAQKMEQALIEAQTANKQKSRFLTSVSHEIRTPLHAILGLIECLQHTALNDQQLQYVHLAQSAGENLLNMVNDVLDLGRIEAGKREVHASVFNPRTLLDEHLEIYRHSINEKGLALYQIEAADTPNRIFSDMTIVRQILTNLLSNAYQYTERGAITVKSWFEAGTGEQGLWCCQISDTGHGFTKAQLAQLFHEFTRFHQSQAKGTGVGLMICQHLTHLLGGELEVSSEAGQGAAFTLKLPAQARNRRSNFKMLKIATVFLWSTDALWLSCLTQQLSALGVQNIRTVDLNGLMTLPPDGIVITDKISPPASEICAQLPHLSFISTGTEVRESWMNCPRHFAFLAQPFRQLDLIRSLRAARRQQRWIQTARRYVSPTPILLPPTSAQAFHVLLVDDSEVNRLTIKTFLGLEGIKVTEATDGAEAVKLVRQQQFDLILMDLRMPVLGGLEATQQIRLNQLADLTPIIALTAHVQEEEKQQCLQAGMQDFLTKPIGKAMLMKRVMQWLKPQEKIAQPEQHPVPDRTPAGFVMSPLIDDLQLSQFKSELSEDNYQRLIKIFLAESTRQVQDVMQFLQEQQFDRVEILAHSLKSSALTFGATRMSHIAKATELACRRQQTEQIRIYCQQLVEVNQLTHDEFARR